MQPKHLAPWLAGGFALIVSISAAPAQKIIHEAFPEAAPTALPQPPPPVPLSLQLYGAAVKNQAVFELPPLSPEEVQAADRAAAADNCCGQQGPTRVALTRALGPAPLAFAEGASRRRSADGRSVWTLSVRSPGALATRLRFTNVHLGAGTLLVYSIRDWQAIVRGPFTSSGPDQRVEFWSPSLPGDTVIIEVSGTDDFQLDLAEILHFDSDLAGQAGGRTKELSCHIDVMCRSVNVQARDAVGQMNFVKDGGGFVCSGALLTDYDPDTRMPYFLTAYHCLHEQPEVDSLEVVWLYQTSGCGGALPDYWTLPRNEGGVLLANSETWTGNDMTFVRLNGAVPTGVTTAGWTTGYSDTSYGIHHPDGSWKRVTYYDDSSVLSMPTCLVWHPDHYHFVKSTSGTMEGGSSGSPLLNASGQVMGQLYGHCGVVTDITCSTSRDNWRAIYGEFEETFSNIRYWLELGGTLYVDAASPSFPGNGLSTLPYRMVLFANNAAWDGCRIKIRPGFYLETATFNKKLTIMADGGPVTIGY